jgi:maltose O-acetyltransferase
MKELPTRRSSVALRVRHTVAYILYYGIAQKLPRSYTKGGAAGRAARGWAVSRMLDHVGPEINVEHGAVFGSGKGIRLGARSGIGVNADLHGTITIGDDVMMGPGCIMVTRNHSFDRTDIPMNQQGFGEDLPIFIEDDVWLGINVTLMPGVRVGRGSIVAAGAVVTRDVPPYTIVAGVPAAVIASRGASQSDSAIRPGAES